MNNKYFILLFSICLFTGCKQDMHLNKIKGERIEINDSLTGKQDIEDYIKPFREHVNKDMDSILAYAVDTYSKTDGDLNTAIGNLMADAVLELSNPIFNTRTGHNIDMVILNHGGIRAIMSQGNITTKTAYELMPFDNEVVVVEMKGVIVKELVGYLQRAKRAHPIAGLNIKLKTDGNILESTIDDKSINDDETYHVATSDYLYEGGDRMTFLKKGDSLHVLDYKIRNVLIDYFKKHDTLNPVIDNRFIQIK